MGFNSVFKGLSKVKISSQHLDDKRMNVRKGYGSQVHSGISKMLLQNHLEQTFREKCAQVRDEQPDAKI